MVFDGVLLQQLVVQTPVVAILLIFIILDRREHQATIKAMREDNAKLEAALIDHMNRLNE
jgi:hypothetical protein